MADGHAEFHRPLRLFVEKCLKQNWRPARKGFGKEQAASRENLLNLDIGSLRRRASDSDGDLLIAGRHVRRNRYIQLIQTDSGRS